jgi:DNA polymerase bacteriophage-type
MRYVSFDVESRSEVDLKEAGGWTYSKHKSTRGICAAITDADKVLTWRVDQPMPAEFRAILCDPEVIWCGINVLAFDRLMWQHCFTKRHDWPACPPADRWDDTMHRLYTANCPGSLEDGGHALRAPIKKDMVGHALMLKMCKPQRVTKNLTDPWRLHTAENITRLTEYCVTDTKAEACIAAMLPPASPREKQVIQMDAAINDVGVMIDLPFVRKLIAIRDKNAEELKEELAALTNDCVTGGSDLRGLAVWLSGRGIHAVYEKGGMDKKAMVEKILPQIAEKGDEVAERVIAIRGMLGKTSLSKLDRMLVSTDPETGRVHWIFQYGGAHTTLRWAGRTVQGQNLPRGILKDAEVDIVRQIIADSTNAENTYDTLSILYGANKIFDLLSGMIRCCFVAKPGHTFVIADLSSIEPITTAWMSECPALMAILLEKSPGFYKHMAAIVYDKPATEVTAEERGDGGKKVGISWTYGAGDKRLHEHTKLPLETCTKLVTKLRSEYKEVCDYWEEIGQAMMLAMRNPQSDFHAGPCTFRFERPHLRLQLPSGRWLTYRDAFIAPGKFGKPAVFYWYEDSMTKQWVSGSVWGGSVLENLVQAVDRDVQARNLFCAWKQGLNPVLHAHDEIGCEVPIAEAKECLIKLQKILATPVDYMPGLPVGSAGFISPFYKKG